MHNKNATHFKRLFMIVSALFALILLTDGLFFNRDYLIRRFSGLEEQRYLVNMGELYQFEFVQPNKLIAQNDDPNISIYRINEKVETILIKCRNTASDAIGQLFYRTKDEEFSELKSVYYNASEKNPVIALPIPEDVFALRIDLTNIEGDKLICKEFVLNPYVPFDRNPIKLGIYTFIVISIMLYQVLKFKEFFRTLSNMNAKLIMKQFDFWISTLVIYLKENSNLIIAFIFVALVSYGFELFNLNLTVDEEYYANATSVGVGWIGQGRWGMYFLNKYLLPYNVLPFVPLGIALFFQIIGILLTFKSWGIENKFDQFSIGIVSLTFPGLAYVYTFSTLNYGVGIGFFFVSLSLLLYTQNSSLSRFLAAIPAAFSISIYQGFIPVLVLIFLTYLIIIGIHEEKKLIVHLRDVIIVHILSFLIYYVVLKFLFFYYQIVLSDYITGFFAIGNILENFGANFSSFIDIITQVYFGDQSIYTFNLSFLKVLLFFGFLGFAQSLRRSSASIITKLFVMSSGILLTLLPFVSGFLMNGIYGMRFLIGIPITLSSLTMLGMKNNSRIYRMLVFIVVITCAYQFAISTNRLFASSYIALEADRLLASRLIERIELAKPDIITSEKLEYMEIIGYLDRSATQLMPKVSTFGASFFEWDLGNTSRALSFMMTIGYDELLPLPNERRAEFIQIVNEMPIWPDRNSVKIIGDTVLVKFGDYSYYQKIQICNTFTKETTKFYNLCE